MYWQILPENPYGGFDNPPGILLQNTEMAGLRETYVTMLDTIMELKLQEYENVIRVKNQN